MSSPEPRFFPESESRADLAACRAMLRGGSKSFFTASLLLPRHVLEPATALYAFCRQADDAIDHVDAKQAALAALHDRLDAAYAGRPHPFPADRAFATTVARTAMPRALPEALLDGFAWDAEARRYETPAALYDYAARVAGSVGAMMAVLMGARSATALNRACELGIAMQLTNIVRDVGEDARAGRLYLPLAWLREAGIDPDAFLAKPAFSPALATVIRRLQGSSQRLYARGMAGIAELPPACRPGIRAAGLIYAAIGRRAAHAGYDTVTTRLHVGTTRKAALLVRSLAPAGAPLMPAETRPLPASRWLVEAATMPARPRAARRPMGDQFVWILDLFERLGDQAQAGEVQG